MKNRIYLLILAFSLASSACNFSSGKKNYEDQPIIQPPTPISIKPAELSEWHSRLDTFFDNNLFRSGFNGGVLVAKGGTIIYEKYMGRVDLRRQDSVNQDIPFHLASASKPFTATAILQLIQKGKLALNDSVSKFFPGLPYPGITIRMLLNHHSGLPNYVYFIPNSDWDKGRYVTNEDVLQLLYTEQPERSFPPGERFSYSNTNFVLLAMIVEKISGMSYPQYMQQHIFKRLQMEHSWVFTLADSLRATPSFTWKGEYWANDFLEGTYGDKNIYSTPRDLLKFDQALYAGELIDTALLDSAFTPYTIGRQSQFFYGLGWRMRIMPNGKKVIYHFGRWHGFNAAFSRLTDEKVTIIILGNRFNRNIYNAAFKSYNLFGDYFHETENTEEETESAPVISKKTTNHHRVIKIARHGKPATKRKQKSAN